MSSGSADHRNLSRPGITAGPRLGLAQLLVWIAGIGAYLAIFRGLALQEPNAAGILGAFALAVGVGTAWAGGFILAVRALSDQRWPVEPGHWLLALTGIGHLIDVLLQIMPETVFARADLVLSALVCWLLVLPMFSQHLNARWKGFFFLMLFLHAAPLLWGCLGMVGFHWAALRPRIATALSFATDPVAAGFLLTTCVLDRQAGERRDWLHWCGVVVFLWLAVLRVAFMPQA